ncbi:hypothetical protein [Castellaniella sp.]|uniref:hypothetical protein n=1 Tax=Castellaniella sp. TaxID=1955812 RepID=UPI002AFE0263|nr:hypothetical protein [Castellaniella sp.]
MSRSFILTAAQNKDSYRLSFTIGGLFHQESLRLAEPVAVAPGSTDARTLDPIDEPEADPPAPVRTTVAARSLTVSYQKAWVADEADVEHYLESLRQALLQAIQAGHKVQL